MKVIEDQEEITQKMKQQYEIKIYDLQNR